ncbi:BREX-1 system adenine-specific DNA-methyltransferase PglX [Aeromonas caviae]|uniref:BREX-1 system adenine-specific DNA-methyltransferase PglX n=1 Tax=Aeromonas caviae TaxID=648 RepID=UPI0029DE23DD|nr:BREX-1 system adenine-specific DNA-methyltransferase PglX [Aeromonas caviae]MDX7825412.1 BREX-1 system adenine-specific DNA-methyltransferase PglX [Aeromonas caviae]
MSQQKNNNVQKHFYRASAENFMNIPGNPVAYWVSKKLTRAYEDGIAFESIAEPRVGLDTGNNERFIRFFHEVEFNKIGFNKVDKEQFWNDNAKYVPHTKGGGFRKWFGNFEYVLMFDHDNYHRLLESGNHLPSRTYYFKEGANWSRISTDKFSIRYTPQGFVFNSACPTIFSKTDDILILCSFLMAPVATLLLSAISPTTNFQAGEIRKLPIIKFNREVVLNLTHELVLLAKNDWNAYESSWDFSSLPLLSVSFNSPQLKTTYQNLHTYRLETVLETRRLEEECNRIFIDAYGLQDELTPEVPLSEITLTCNPHYRYGGNLTDDEREARLQSDTLCELISYAIGCMMGRYSLDRDGLVYAHAGNEGFKALVEEGAYATFAADDDGILPLTSENWFADDVAARIEQFVRTVWGAETLEENLQFIADSLCLAAIKPVKKGGETARETIRRYLSTQFFKDHMKTYKKRPIYWLFSSGKEKAFECLVYLHRYNEATLPRMRTEYVTPLLGQMAGRIERLRLQQAEAGTAEAKRIGKEIETLTKQLAELRAFDDELKHHADMRIRLDLDDGVKVNYGKFGTLLSEVKAITGDKGE